MQSTTNVGQFGTRLRSLRSQASIGMRRLARLAEAGPAVIYQLERGLIQRPNAELALRIARVLGADPAYMVLGEGEPPDEATMRAAIDAACAADAAVRASARAAKTQPESYEVTS